MGCFKSLRSRTFCWRGVAITVLALQSCFLSASVSASPVQKTWLPAGPEAWNTCMEGLKTALDEAISTPKSFIREHVEKPAHEKFLKHYKQTNPGRKLHGMEEIVISNSTVEETLQIWAQLPREQFDDILLEEGELDSFSESVHTRKLKQITIGGQNVPIGNYANAFTVLFSNLFDFALLDGTFALIPILADAFGLTQNWNWIADLANFLDSPFDNIVNAQYFPLPQNDAEFEDLIKRFTSDFCVEEEASPSALYLGRIEGPTFSVAVSPWSCPIATDEETYERSIDWENCEGSELTISLTPTEVTEWYKSAAAYAGAECKFTQNFGTPLSLAIGGGEQVFTLRLSEQGIDIIPLINQFSTSGRFGVYVPPPLPEETLGPRPNGLFEGQIAGPNTESGSGTGSLTSSIRDVALGPQPAPAKAGPGGL